MRSGSADDSPTVMRGLREAYGSWKMICMLRRERAHLVALEREMSLTVEDDLALGRLEQAEDQRGRRRLAAARLADEAERLAALMEKRTPSTALTSPTWREKTPLRDREVLGGLQTSMMALP